MTREQEFKVKLDALLKEYSARIGLETGVGSDWYGIYDEKMVVIFDGDVKNSMTLCEGNWY